MNTTENMLFDDEDWPPCETEESERTVLIDMESLHAMTEHLTLKQVGIHFILLCVCWAAPGREMPDDRDWIIENMKSDWARTPGFYEAKIKPILEEFFELNGSHWIEKIEIAI